MPKYQCPECEAVLRRENAVPEGKRIKCPKCETLFKPKPMRDEGEDRGTAKKKAKAVPASVPDGDDDEATGGSYDVISEREDPNKKEVHYGSLRDKFKKSKRGPAMAKLVKLTNGMLLIGIATGIGGVVGIIRFLWPFIFHAEGEGPHGSKSTHLGLMVLASFGGFVYACCMCYGGSKMHDLRSYAWSVAASAMTAILGVIELIGVVWFGIKSFGGDDDSEALLQMVLFLAVALGLAWSLFSCSIGVRSLTRLREVGIREGFEETKEMRDY